MARQAPSTTVGAYMGDFVPVVWQREHTGMRYPNKHSMPPACLLECPCCFAVIAKYPPASRPSVGAINAVLVKVHRHILEHTITAYEDRGSFTYCTTCRLFIPLAAGQRHATSRPHLFKVPWQVSASAAVPHSPANPVAAVNPFLLGSPARAPRVSVEQQPTPDQQPASPVQSDDDGPISPAPLAAGLAGIGRRLGPPPIPEPYPVEAPHVPVADSLSNRGNVHDPSNNLVGRVFIAHFGSSRRNARWCVDEYNQATKTMVVWDFDKCYDINGARALDARAATRELLPRQRTAARPVRPRTVPVLPQRSVSTRSGGLVTRSLARLALSPHEYAISSRAYDPPRGNNIDVRQNRRSKTINHTQVYLNATIALPLLFWESEFAASLLPNIDAVHFPYLRLLGTVVPPRPTTIAGEHAVFFAADGDYTDIDTKTVHTYLHRESAFMPPKDLLSFVSLSDDDTSSSEGESDDDDVDSETGVADGAQAPSRKRPRSARPPSASGDGDDVIGDYDSEPACRLVHAAVVYANIVSWLPRAHVLLDDLSHRLASDARCSVCFGSAPEESLAWCSGQFPAGRGPEYKCHRALICLTCADSCATQDAVCAKLGISLGLRQTVISWMVGGSVTFGSDDVSRRRWEIAVDNVRQSFWGEGAPLASRRSDWESLRGKKTASQKAVLAVRFLKRGLDDPSDHMALILHAVFRGMAIDAHVTVEGPAGQADQPVAVWSSEEEACKSLPVLRKLKARVDEARRYYDRHLWLCAGCLAPAPTNNDIWGPMSGRDAFDPVNPSTEGVRPLYAPFTLPDSMRDVLALRDGLYVPSITIQQRANGRRKKVLALQERVKDPLDAKHILGAEIIQRYALDARLSRANTNKLLTMLDDLKIAGVINDPAEAEGHVLPLIPKTAATLCDRAAVGEEITTCTVEVTEQAFCAIGLGQLQPSATLVAINNPLIVIQELVLDPRISEGFELERPSPATPRPARGDTGPEFCSGQQCAAAWASVPGHINNCVMVSLWSDKTDVQACGGAQYPLMLKIANLRLRMYNKRCSSRIIAILPKALYRLTHGGKKVRKTDYQLECERQLIHDAIGQVLHALSHAAEHGFWLDTGGGRLVLAVVRVVVFPMDLAEKQSLSGMAAIEHCAECLGPSYAGLLGMRRRFLNLEPHLNCATAMGRTSEEMLRQQQLTLLRCHLGGKTTALAASRELGYMTHPSVRSSMLGMPHLFAASTGGFQGTLIIDYLHVFKIGVIPKFFKLFLPLVYLWYRRHDGDGDPSRAVQSTADVQQLIEEKLAQVPTMRDGNRRLQSLSRGWWTMTYWMGDDWVTFMQSIIYAVGASDDLITCTIVRTCVLRTLRMIFKIFKVTKALPAKYSVDYLDDIERTTFAILAGLGQMQDHLEGPDNRTEVEGQKWGDGADTVKPHGLCGIARALVKVGADSYSCTSFFEAHQAILKDGPKTMFVTSEAVLVPVALLKHCYVNQARTWADSDGNGSGDHLSEDAGTRVFDPHPGRGGSGWQSAWKRIDWSLAKIGLSFSSNTLSNIVAGALRCGTGTLDQLTYASCVVLPNAITEEGERLHHVKLRSGECVLVKTEGRPYRVCRFIIAIGLAGEDPTCIVQEFGVVEYLPGGHIGARDPSVGLVWYRISEDHTRLKGSCLIRMEHLVPRGDDVYWHERGIWHVGTKNYDTIGAPRDPCPDDATELLESNPTHST